MFSFQRRRFLKALAFGAGALQTGLDCYLTSSFAQDRSIGANNDQNKLAFPEGFELTLVSKYERKPDSYTQGLLYEFDQKLDKGVLYESGGRYGRSLLRKVEADTGKVLKQVKIPRQFFAEGLAAVEDRLYLLTWRERTCFVYNKDSFEQVDEFRYVDEGWGLTYDGKSLIMSDGSSNIRFLDPQNFRQLKRIDVHYITKDGKRRPVHYLNELEMVNDEIWANVYQQEYVVRINPENGLILGKALDFSALTPKSLKSSSEYVLNGLAFDHSNGRLYVTGKCWPIMYVFSVKPKTTKSDD